MHFASLEYAVLLTLAFIVTWSNERAPMRLIALLAASYVFYAWWNAYYLLLIVGSSLLDYYVGLKVHASVIKRQRKAWLLTSLVGNLGLLALFKYYNFFAANVAAGLTAMGIDASLPALNVLLPVGISFFTFQSMSYTIDIYRGELKPVDQPLSFLVFVSFFPQLVAGPIVRARQFLPQLAVTPRLDPKDAGRGYFLIALGLLKKAIIADLLAVNLADRIFESPTLYTSAEAVLGVYAYALQIYCDFSAYSDIAIGSALLLGLTLPQNFNAPYRAANLRDFWRRWHISLSTWLRDYLYIPLGGSAGSALATYRNLAITMLLGGLWHGAAWNFVVWGAMHGGGLAFARALQIARGRELTSFWARGLGILITFHFVCLSWIFFRAPNFETAWQVLQTIGALTGGTANVSPMLWALLAAGAMTHIVPDVVHERAEAWTHRLPPLVIGLLLLSTVVAVRYAATANPVPFIYFQF
jgi:alginate O-acetyltransferase complex protein AlgI